MHGRVKSAQAVVTAAELAAQQKKAATYSELSKVLLLRRKNDVKCSETLELTAKMLRSNPDFYTLWNYRKDIIVQQCLDGDIPLAAAMAHKGDRSFAVPLAAGEAMLQVELGLTADAIRKNPKCYGAWYHRQWMITYFEFHLKAELGLCAALLMTDQRNFHCWNYRRHITLGLSPGGGGGGGGGEGDGVYLGSAGSGKSIDEGQGRHMAATVSSEFQFSTDKLNENFSNYSAFHHRSVCIQCLPSPSLSPSFRALMSTELSLVENAIFTEPDDQSAWWYRRFLFAWLLERAKAAVAGGKGSGSVDDIGDFLRWIVALVGEQVVLLEGLLKAEEGCKWAMDAIVGMVRMLLDLKRLAGPALAEEIDPDLLARRSELLAQLEEVDPHRRLRYQALLRTE